MSYVSPDAASALGDIRRETQLVVVWKGAQARADWPRYADAIAAAVTRGAEVRQMGNP